MNAQSGRLGIEYAALAGYDPRQVREAYKALAQKSAAGMKLKSAERSYYAAASAEAQAELGTEFTGRDFSKFRSEGDSFRQFTEVLKAARR